MPGTGDVWSAAADLTRFIIALHAGKLITARSLREMCTPHAPLADDDPGYRSFAGWIPDRAASLVILVNDETNDVVDLVRQVLPAALEP
jgi:hypothetical protein